MVKLPPLVAVPFGVVTEIGPVVAPAGTLAWISVPLVKRKSLEGVPLNVTEVAPVKFVPLITIGNVLTLAPVGVKPVIVGGPEAVPTETETSALRIAGGGGSGGGVCGQKPGVQSPLPCATTRTVYVPASITWNVYEKEVTLVFAP